MSAATKDPGATLYALIGGAATLHRLLDRFYDLMDSAPEYYGIRKLHPAELTG